MSDGTTHEHTVGARSVRDADLVFESVKSMRFTDPALIDILMAMRTPGGNTLSDQQ